MKLHILLVLSFLSCKSAGLSSAKHAPNDRDPYDLSHFTFVRGDDGYVNLKPKLSDWKTMPSCFNLNPEADPFHNDAHGIGSKIRGELGTGDDCKIELTDQWRRCWEVLCGGDGICSVRDRNPGPSSESRAHPITLGQNCTAGK